MSADVAVRKAAGFSAVSGVEAYCLTVQFQEAEHRLVVDFMLVLPCGRFGWLPSPLSARKTASSYIRWETTK